MKLTITTTYSAKRMTIKQLLKYEYGMFILSVSDEPVYVRDNMDWLASQNLNRIGYLLDEEESEAVLK